MKSLRSSLFLPFLMVGVAMGFTACKSVYYKTLEAFDVEKRHILVDRVEEAKESQEEAKEQFADALEAFLAVSGYDGGELQEQYERLKDAFEDSEDRAAAVTDRIDSVDSVARDLFKEWEEELDVYQNVEYRRLSEKSLRETRARYGIMLRRMRQAEERMEPVLSVFRDQVLFLKHNLNARAIDSLSETSSVLQSEVSALIEDMNRSIEEAVAFIDTIRPESE